MSKQSNTRSKKDKKRKKKHKHKSLPDFALAPVVDIPPKILLQNSKVDALVLALALIFNDLKAVMWLKHQLDKGKPETLSKTAHSGQYVGMGAFVSRQLLGIANELIELLYDAKKKKILSDPSFVEAVERLPKKAGESWNEIVMAVTEPNAKAPLRTYLSHARNKVSFHYDRHKLLEGYVDHFTKQPTTPFNEAACVSFGRTMEETRFYFADAAAVAVYGPILDTSGELFKEADKMFARINDGLRWLVESYIGVRLEADEKKRAGIKPTAV